MKLKPAIATLLVAGALLGACGGGSGNKGPLSFGQVGSERGAIPAVAKGAPAKGGIDPCKLVTADEAQAALGEPVKGADRAELPAISPLGQQICSYVALSDRSFRSLQVSVVRSQDMDPAVRRSGYDARKLFDESKKLFSDGENVSGVGDAAYRLGDDLHAVKGSTYVTVSIYGVGTSKASAVDVNVLRSLAQKALERAG